MVKLRTLLCKILRAAAIAAALKRLPLSPASALRVVSMMAVPLFVTLLATSASGQGANQAALVVVHGDGRVATRCVGFAEPDISGAELLQRSGLDLNLEATSIGATICRINGEGCSFPRQSCFCECEGENCRYWSYWRWEGNAWRYAQQGASNTRVLPRSIEAWVWGAGTVSSATPPPPITFDQVCTAPTPTATATAPATATASATATAPVPATPMPASGESPTAVSTPVVASATPTASPTTIAQPLFEPMPTFTTLPATQTPIPTLVAPATAPPIASPLPTADPRLLPEIELFAADRKDILAGEVVTLYWRVQNAGALQLQASGQTVDLASEGSLLLAPPQNTTYRLVAGNERGAISTAMTIIVRPNLSTDRAVNPMTDEQATPSATPIPDVSSPLPPVEIVVADVLTGQMDAAPAVPVIVTSLAIETALAPVAVTLAPFKVDRVPGTSAISPPLGNPGVESHILLHVGLFALAGIPVLAIAGTLVIWLLQHQ